MFYSKGCSCCYICVYYVGFRFLLFFNLILTRKYFIMKKGIVDDLIQLEKRRESMQFVWGTHQSVVIDDKWFLFIHGRRMDYCGRFWTGYISTCERYLQEYRISTNRKLHKKQIDNSTIQIKFIFGWKFKL